MKKAILGGLACRKLVEKYDKAMHMRDNNYRKAPCRPHLEMNWMHRIKIRALRPYGFVPSRAPSSTRCREGATNREITDQVANPKEMRPFCTAFLLLLACMRCPYMRLQMPPLFLNSARSTEVVTIWCLGGRVSN